MKPPRALEALNFFMADVQAGLGPFIGVFLLSRGWAADAIGSVMMLGGIAGMIATAPSGALVDATRHKRAVVVVAGLMTTFASLALWVSHGYWTIAASQVAGAVTGAALSPALGGLLAQRFGYATAFVALGAVSLGSLALWLIFSRSVRHACRADAQPASPTATHEVALRYPD